MYETELKAQLAHERDINDSLRNQLAKERALIEVQHAEIARLRNLHDVPHVRAALRASGALSRAQAAAAADTVAGALT